MQKSLSAKIVLACLIIASTTSFIVIPMIEKNSLRKMQTVLANLLEVNINDYPNPKTFPIGYFETVLKPGMSNEAVHNYIQGYDSVYHCEGGFNFEVYNYFSKSKYYWLVILIPYDEHKQYDGDFKVWVDPNTNTVSGRACEEGVLQ